MASRFTAQRRRLLALIAGALAISPFNPAAAAPPSGTDLLQTIINRGTIRIGVSPDLPGMAFRNPESGVFVGAEVLLGRTLARGLLGSDRQVEFSGLLPGNRINALLSGTVDLVIAQLTITPERQTQVDFSMPYVTAHEAVLVLADSAIHDLQDLQKRSVAVAEGSATEQRYRRSQPGIKLIVTKHESGGVELVRLRQVAGMANDDLNLNGLMLSFKDPQTFRIVNVGRCFAPKPFGIAMGKGNPALMAAVDRQLIALQRQGSLANMFAEVQKPEGDSRAVASRPCPPSGPAATP